MDRDHRAELLLVQRLHPDRTWVHSEVHRHEDRHELVYVVAGKYRWTCQGKELTAGNGTCFIHEQGLEHGCNLQTGPETVLVLVQWRGLALPDGLARHLKDRDGRAIDTLRWIEDLWRSDGPDDHETASLLLQALLHELARTRRPHIDNRVECVITWMRHHLHEPVTLRDLAAVLGVTPSYLARLFKRAIGMSPMRRLRQERVAAARRLLAAGTESLPGIARMTGFGGQQQMTRIIQAETGRTPGAIRRGG